MGSCLYDSMTEAFMLQLPVAVAFWLHVWVDTGWGAGP